jgi:SAM-dependent methyltransferase
VNETERYVTDAEYETYFEDLSGLRARVAADLPIPEHARILDIPTGSGYFAIALAERERTADITGIDIASPDLRRAARHIGDRRLGGRVQVMGMDAARLAFGSGLFDAATSFLGLEDVHMTRGRQGVAATFAEVGRVLRPGGRFSFVVMPPEEMETEAQRIEVAVFSAVCGATWLSGEEYEAVAVDAGLDPVERRIYRTGKKLTAEQARNEIRYACENVPKIYGVRTPGFDQVWARFGTNIEKHGIGHYSKVVLIVARRRE